MHSQTKIIEYLFYNMVSFEEACELAKNFSKKASDSEFLEFYGLFKQASFGDCNIDKAGVLDLKKKAMWEAWNSRKGLSQDAAKAAYIQDYEKYAPKYT